MAVEEGGLAVLLLSLARHGLNIPNHLQGIAQPVGAPT
jgi:hypothetical protein